jgi:hypothetical protein
MNKIIKHIAVEFYFLTYNLIHWLNKINGILCDYAEIDLGE